MPKAAAADNPGSFGLRFLADIREDKLVSAWALSIASTGGISLSTYSGGSWRTVAVLSDPKNPKFTIEPESIVALRAVTKATLMIVSVNGVELRRQRIQAPEGKLLFGITVWTDKPVPAPGATFEFKRYKVTAGE